MVGVGGVGCGDGDDAAGVGVGRLRRGVGLGAAGVEGAGAGVGAAVVSSCISVANMSNMFWLALYASPLVELATVCTKPSNERSFTTSLVSAPLFSAPFASATPEAAA